MLEIKAGQTISNEIKIPATRRTTRNEKDKK
jgi:hypothetical protein